MVTVVFDRQMGWSFWVDRGGTFTDLIGCDPQGTLHVRKLLSESIQGGDPAVSAMADLVGCAPGCAIPPGLISSVRLGTTVATNALLENRQAPVLLLTNVGLADQLRIGDQHRSELFALQLQSPPFLAEAVVEVGGRLASSGDVVEPLRIDSDLRQRLAELQGSGLDVAVVALLHAHRDPVHELACADLLRELGFGTVVCSHEVSAKPRLVPRGQTALVEGAVAPVLQGYLQQVQNALGVGTPLRVMTSSGALQAPEVLLAKDTILSGPAAGMVGAVAAARAAGYAQVPVLGFDMGGTSTDVFCVASAEKNALQDFQSETEIAGLTLQADRLPIETVAAGGGSVIEQHGMQLRVGPRSAGARPGPACYRSGGPLTITDANLLLGRLRPDQFPAVFGPARDLPPDASIVQRQFAELSKSLHRSAESVAESALQLAVERMAAAIRRVSLHRGQDIRGGVLVAYGGASGQHACRLAEELGITSVLLHPLGGVLSAYGMGQARQSCRLQRHVEQTLSSHWLESLPDQVSDLVLRARQRLHQQGDFADAGAENDISVTLDLRYSGADQLLGLPWSSGISVADLLTAFQSRHQQRFGYCVQGDQHLVVEMIRVEVAAPQQFRAEPPGGGAISDHPPVSGGCVPLHDPSRGWADVPFYERSSLQPGQHLCGPALIVEAIGCTVVEAGWRARVHQDGALLLDGSRISSEDSVRQRVDVDDPLESELFRHRFMAIAEQMGERLQQSSRSVNIRERLDFSCALFDADGGLVANAPHIPVHLGSMGDCVRDLLSQLEVGALDCLKPGDTWLSNDPFHGGTHLPDITAITPVFFNDARPDFFVASRGHHADVGGLSPGSMPSFSRTIDDEGLRLRTFLFVRDGLIRTDQLEAISDRLVTPPRNKPELYADLQAQVAANQSGVDGLKGLVQLHGKAVVQRQMVLLQRHGARSVRQLILRLAEGQRQLTLDDGSRLVLSVGIDRNKARMTLDFSGTSQQHAGNLNAPLAVTRAVVLYVVRCLLEDDIPLNDGCFEPISLIVPEGCLLNPLPPAAVVAGNVELSQALCNLLFGAFGVLAAGQGTMNNVSFGNDSGQYYETVAGGGGAGHGFHGSVGLQSHMTNSRLTDPEVLESRYPVRLEQFSIRRASGGLGRWRGGDGLERTIRFLQPMRVSLISGSRSVAPFGLHGGGEGACGANAVLHADGREESVPGSVQLDLKAGDAIRLQTPGGGGMGGS